jgi:hypothetical protein
LPTPATEQQGEAEKARQEREDASNRRDEDDLKAQQSMADSARELVDLTRWQIAVGLLGLLGLGWTIYYTRQTARAAVDAANASVKAANVAEKALTHLERPYIFPIIDDGTSVANMAQGRWAYFVKFRLHNFGKTPALIKSVLAELRPFERLPDELRYSISPDPVESANVLGTGEASPHINRSIRDLTSSEWDDVKKGRKFLCVYGAVIYEDVLECAAKPIFAGYVTAPMTGSDPHTSTIATPKSSARITAAPLVDLLHKAVNGPRTISPIITLC